MLMLLKILTLVTIITNEKNFCKADPLGGMTDVADEGEFPFVVSIGVSNLDHGDPNVDQYEHICGGGLITRTHVLTAEHCIKDIKTGYYYFARVGSADLQHSTTYLIQSWTKYDEWVKETSSRKCHDFKYNDIAIVELDGSVNSSITIPRVSTRIPQSFDNGQQGLAVTAGWGLPDRAVSKKLLKANLRFIKHSKCEKRISNSNAPFSHERNLICTKGAESSVILHDGDSGSPLFMRRRNGDYLGDYQIVGVNHASVIWKSKDRSHMVDEQNIHVSVYYYLSFIKHVTNVSYLPLVEFDSL